MKACSRRAAAVVTVALATLLLALAAPVAANDNGDTIVHTTRTGHRYHRAGCSSLRYSDYTVTLREAVTSGLTPCMRCNPPLLRKSPGARAVKPTPSKSPTQRRHFPKRSTPALQRVSITFTLHGERIGSMTGVEVPDLGVVVPTRNWCDELGVPIQSGHHGSDASTVYVEENLYDDSAPTVYYGLKYVGTGIEVNGVTYIRIRVLADAFGYYVDRKADGSIVVQT